MDWDAIWKWLVAPGGLLAGLAAWLVRRRRPTAPGSGSWISRRLAVERSLLRCQQERADDQSSFSRQLTGRDQEIAYLMAKLSRLTATAAEVIQASDAASANPSGPSGSGPTPSPTSSPPSPATSPPSPAKPRP